MDKLFHRCLNNHYKQERQLNQTVGLFLSPLPPHPPYSSLGRKPYLAGVYVFLSIYCRLSPRDLPWLGFLSFSLSPPILCSSYSNLPSPALPLSLSIPRGVQYVHCVMHKCVMVTVGGKRKTQKVCKKNVNFM